MPTASFRALLLGGALSLTAPALAQAPTDAGEATPAPDASGPADTLPTADAAPDAAPEPPAKTTDILSADTLTLLVDGRFVLADGGKSFVDGGLGKTRFDGNRNGDLVGKLIPVEADLIWSPRFTSTLSGNVSAAWQRDQENPVDLIEAFVTWLPERGRIGVSAKAGLYWPEISLEHATGGAWSTVNTITPSAINSWVGEETKVVGGEVSLYASAGQHDFNATVGVFGLNDTSGTLLSFRGWALHDIKATAFGHFELPPLNPFIRLLQENRTRSTIDLDNRPGFYGRLEWRPPWPFSINVFYYDNRGNPEAFNPTNQWGWRTRFLNVGLSADLGAGTRLLAQGMVGTTQMGFKENGVPWVDTYYRSAYVLLTHDFGKFALTGRAEAFGTHERESEMSPENGEDGAAFTLAARAPITNRLTGFVEALHVRSSRGTRVDIGLPAFEAQTVAQAALRFRW